jgi:hypothetical protein
MARGDELSRQSSASATSQLRVEDKRETTLSAVQVSSVRAAEQGTYPVVFLLSSPTATSPVEGHGMQDTAIRNTVFNFPYEETDRFL